ncbi:hypothetical protein [Azonexus sp. R2A61]|uniref:hypothetical protein n=1 Tax=Azonexus sp. R2A61 TaxID=2744443 RepID=UPI001F16DB6B|nr:hypothetical protein [Azonexus sp. R2A61]
MRVFIDISLLTPSTAIGRVSGPMDFPSLPRTGELVSLSSAVVPNAGFSGQIAVQQVIHSPTMSGQEPMLSLADIVSPTPEAAASIGQALEQFYGLFFEAYEK